MKLKYAFIMTAASALLAGAAVWHFRKPLEITKEHTRTITKIVRMKDGSSVETIEKNEDSAKSVPTELIGHKNTWCIGVGTGLDRELKQRRILQVSRRVFGDFSIGASLTSDSAFLTLSLQF